MITNFIVNKNPIKFSINSTHKSIFTISIINVIICMVSFYYESNYNIFYYSDDYCIYMVITIIYNFVKKKICNNLQFETIIK